MGLEMAVGCSSGAGITMAPGGSTGLSELYGPTCSMTLGHQCGLRWLTRHTQATTWPSVATGATDINSDPGCCKGMDPDMDLSSTWLG